MHHTCYSETSPAPMGLRLKCANVSDETQRTKEGTSRTRAKGPEDLFLLGRQSVRGEENTKERKIGKTTRE